jgi:hypothetical protein
LKANPNNMASIHKAMVGTKTDLRKVKTALLSVFNKDGLEEFGLFLQSQGVTIGMSFLLCLFFVCTFSTIF